jgi:hypothetical protein
MAEAIPVLSGAGKGNLNPCVRESAAKIARAAQRTQTKLPQAAI